jgi:hypothetical protein
MRVHEEAEPDGQRRLVGLVTQALRDFFAVEDVVASHAWLGGLYGVQAGTALARTTATGRKGLLTRAAFHLHGAHSAHMPLPHRGYNIKVTMLCGTVGAFPDGIDVSLPANAPDSMTSRQYYSVLTDRPACASCHRDMNPYGYALSAFTVTGKRITTERTMHKVSKAFVDLPVDESASVPLYGASVSVAGASELSEAIGRSKEGMACFAYRFNQFAVGWKEEPHCGVAAAYKTLSQGSGKLEDAIIAYVTSSAFRRR